MSQTVVLKVAMSCKGCSGAVERALGKMEGVESFDVNLKEQKVTVIGNVQPETVFQTVSKTGKKTAFWEESAPDPEPAAETPAPEEAPAPEPAAETPAPEEAPAPTPAEPAAPEAPASAEAQAKPAEAVTAP